MRSIRCGSAPWLSLLFCTLLIDVEAQQTPPPAAPTAAGQGAHPTLQGAEAAARADRNDLCESGMTELSGPLMLQDHIPNGGPMTVMRFRNIWFRPIPPGR